MAKGLLSDGQRDRVLQMASQGVNSFDLCLADGGMLVLVKLPDGSWSGDLYEPGASFPTGGGMAGSLSALLRKLDEFNLWGYNRKRASDR